MRRLGQARENVERGQGKSGDMGYGRWRVPQRMAGHDRSADRGGYWLHASPVPNTKDARSLIGTRGSEGVGAGDGGGGDGDVVEFIRERGVVFGGGRRRSILERNVDDRRNERGCIFFRLKLG